MAVAAKVAQAVIVHATPKWVEGPDNALCGDYDVDDVFCDGYGISYDKKPSEWVHGPDNISCTTLFALSDTKFSPWVHDPHDAFCNDLVDGNKIKVETNALDMTCSGGNKDGHEATKDGGNKGGDKATDDGPKVKPGIGEQKVCGIDGHKGSNEEAHSEKKAPGATKHDTDAPNERDGFQHDTKTRCTVSIRLPTEMATVPAQTTRRISVMAPVHMAMGPPMTMTFHTPTVYPMMLRLLLTIMIFTLTPYTKVTTPSQE
jgi:hypothetical protein